MIKKTSVQLLLLFVGSFALATFLIPAFSLPFIHNEFANILAADTFASFRVSNPLPRMVEHFETIHVLHDPVYASKLPPAEGFVLAIGQLIFGHPIAGVWLWIAAFVTLLHWFLLKWFRPGVAWVGTFLAGVQMGLTCGWSKDFFLHVYRGGAVSAIGAMLVIGGYKDFLKQKSFKSIFILWIGLTVLIFSRPFEGGLIILPFCFLIGFQTLRNFKEDFLGLFKKVWLPFMLLCSLTLFLFGSYNKALTGNPLKMPHAHYSKQYAGCPLFLFQKPFERRNLESQAMQDYADWQAERFEDIRYHLPITSENLYANFRAVVNKLFKLGQHQNRMGAPFMLMFILFGLPLIVRGTEMKLFFAAFSLNYLGMMLLLPVRLDQMGPLLPVFMVLFLALVKNLFEQSGKYSKALKSLAVVILLFLSFWVVERVVHVIQYQYFGHFYNVSYTAHREQLIKQLKGVEGKHLVYVSYAPTHRMTWEWVYNEADMENAEVIFARDLGEEKNESLAAAYPDRTLWVIFVEKDWNIEEPLPLKLVRKPVS